MNKPFRVFGFTASLALICLLFHIPLASATPASPGLLSILQPDGTAISARVLGDEFQRWVETEEGHSVVRNGLTGYWEYGEADPKGALKPGGTRVGVSRRAPLQLEKHLKPVRDTEMERSVSEKLRKISERRTPWRAGPFRAPSSGGEGDGTTTRTMARNPLDSPIDPVSGDKYLLVVLVNFSDRELVSTPMDWYPKIFGTDEGQKSVVNYYRDNSRGRLVLKPAPNTQPGSPPGIVTVTLPLPHPNSRGPWGPRPLGSGLAF